jgi:hypothetical protein
MITMPGFKKNLSYYSVLFCAVTIIVFTLIKGYWKDENKVIVSDVINYYDYLPATFIFHDLGIEKAETIEKGTFWVVQTPIGKHAMKMSMGLSFLYAPFFFAGHAAAKLLGYEAFGFSEPYKFFMVIGYLIYMVVGLIFLRKILLRFFSEAVSALTILAIALGTNLAYYASAEGAMSHIYNFALFNIFIWHTILWYESPTFKRLLGLGALAGLITLIRPSNILILIFFFLFELTSFKLLKERVRFIFKNYRWFLGMMLAFLVVWIPQFIYNLHFTGQLLFYSYTDEKFFFANPQIIDGLFSYRKGWLLYTPMMVIPLIGIFVSIFRKEKYSLAILIFTLVNIYVILSWWCWWYGGSFGQRSFVDSYGLMALPLALVLAEAARLKTVFYKAIVGLVFLIIVFNNFQTQKYLYGSIHFADMTKAAYWHSFWHVRPQPGYWDLLETPDYDLAKKGIYVVQPKN